MNFADYQRAALRTFKAELTQRNLLANGALGLCGEAGEVADLIKKHIYPSKPGDAMQIHRIGDELGDVLWYLAILAEGSASRSTRLRSRISRSWRRGTGWERAGRRRSQKILPGRTRQRRDDAARRAGAGHPPPPRRLVRRCMTPAQALAGDALTHAERDALLGIPSP